MISVIAFVDGRTRRVDAVDPAWLDAASTTRFWVDIILPEPDAARVLGEVMHFHELAVDDALSALHHPKIEAYDGYLYLILHGIAFKTATHQVQTHDIDFFLGDRYLVTVHDGTSRSIAAMTEVCLRNNRVLAEGPASLLHRIVDELVSHYSPEVDKLEGRITELEREVFARPDNRRLVTRILGIKRDIGSLRRVILPERDAVSRLGRGEFAEINQTMAYRFRDVYDHLVRITEDSNGFQDRITGLLDAHLSFQSNRLNEVMKVLTVITVIFMPLTVLTGLYGMNVPLPQFPGGEHVQFWWVVLMIAVIIGGMLWVFRRIRWL
jgi:magnesium transporter